MGKRVVITGLGIVSCLGNDAQTVTRSLYEGRSGIRIRQEQIDMGMRSHVAGAPEIDIPSLVDRKQLRFMADAASYAYIAMQRAIDDSGLKAADISNVRTGIIAGSGGASAAMQVEAADILRERGIRKVGPYRVTQTMGSTVSACLATPFKIKGVNYSISSACSTSAHCIGNAMEQIQLGKQDIVFAGGGEELCWEMACEFDAMGALSTKYNDTPERASRAYDVNRDGFVIAGGHTIDDPEPKYGMAVTGEAHPDRLLTNAGLRAGQDIVLTKALGVGVLTTAIKNGRASSTQTDAAVASMVVLFAWSYFYAPQKPQEDTNTAANTAAQPAPAQPTPETPATRLSQNSWAVSPMGVMAPTPVTSARVTRYSAGLVDLPEDQGGVVSAQPNRGGHGHVH